jgi:DNA polymerase III sliding clamp (beta) subunit (PCNA family)
VPLEIQLPVAALNKALPGLAKAINRHSILPVLQTVRIVRDTEGRVHLQTTDLDCAVVYTLHQEGPTDPAQLLVPFDQLKRPCKGCDANGHIVVAQENHRLKLKYPVAGHLVEQPLATPEPENFPPLPQVAGPSIYVEDCVKDSIARAFQCASEEPSRAAIRGAWLDVTESEAHYVFGTDGRHLYAANSFRLDLQQSVLIPNTSFLTWPRFREDGPWRLTWQSGCNDNDSGWLKVQSDSWTYLTRRPDVEMPQWRSVVPDPHQTKAKVIFSDKAQSLLLEVLPLLPGKDDTGQPVTLDIAEGKLSVIAKDRHSGYCTTIPLESVEVAGSSISITVNRSFIAKALKWGLTVMEIIDSTAPLVFTSPGRTLIAMPMRLEGPAPVPIEKGGVT